MDRPYQERIFHQIREAIRMGYRRILIPCPTGAGKGYMAGRVLQMTAEKGRHSIFFAAQRELIKQIGTQLERIDTPYTTIMAGSNNEYQSSEEYAQGYLIHLIAKDTLWSRAFRRKIIELPPGDIVHIDECHMALSETYQAISASYPDSIHLGWSATPCRSDGRSLGDFYDYMIEGVTYAELQASGFLVPVRCIAPDRPDLVGCKKSRGDYQAKDLQERMNRDSMVGDIIQEWRKHNDGRSTICFAAGISHSLHIRNEFRKIGISAEHVDGTLEESERDDILSRARDGTLRVVCNYGVLHTGVDVPAWKYMICARPTKSFSLWRQMGGRIQRTYKGHDHCFIQDHSDNCLIFGYPDEDVEWSLKEERPIHEVHKENMRKKKPKDGEEDSGDTGNKDPYRCESCTGLYRGPRCPFCGHKPERKPEAIEMSKEELKELDRKKANKEATPKDKQKFWDECLGWAIGKRLKVSSASARYRDRFGVWPNSTIQGAPLASQANMAATDYYYNVVKPERDAAKAEAESSLQSFE